MRISDWSSDVCSSDLESHRHGHDSDAELADVIAVRLSLHLPPPRSSSSRFFSCWSLRPVALLDVREELSFADFLLGPGARLPKIPSRMLPSGESNPSSAPGSRPGRSGDRKSVV